MQMRLIAIILSSIGLLDTGLIVASNFKCKQLHSLSLKLAQANDFVKNAGKHGRVSDTRS